MLWSKTHFCSIFFLFFYFYSYWNIFNIFKLLKKKSGQMTTNLTKPTKTPQNSPKRAILGHFSPVFIPIGIFSAIFRGQIFFQKWAESGQLAKNFRVFARPNFNGQIKVTTGQIFFQK